MIGLILLNQLINPWSYFNETIPNTIQTVISTEYIVLAVWKVMRSDDRNVMEVIINAFILSVLITIKTVR